MSQSNLVHVHHHKPFTDSLVIAEGVGLGHAVVIKTIRKYESDFKEFNPLVLKTRSSGGLETVFAELTEDQATYLITLFRN
jgi:phage regulator Rha-like protein